MTKQQLSELISKLGNDLPDRISGNTENEIIASRLGDIVNSADRATLIDLLRDWISVRIPQSERQPGDGRKEGKLWLALETARKFCLKELRPDIEVLVADINSGKTFLPYYAEMVEKYLNAIPSRNQLN